MSSVCSAILNWKKKSRINNLSTQFTERTKRSFAQIPILGREKKHPNMLVVRQKINLGLKRSHFPSFILFIFISIVID